MTNLDSVLKSRDITLLIKAMVFPVVMDGCESWTIKKADRWRTDAFELWCWRRRLRVPCTERRPNQSILKKINPEYSLEGLMLTLQYFSHLMQRADSLEKTPILGKIEGRRRREWQRMMHSHYPWDKNQRWSRDKMSSDMEKVSVPSLQEKQSRLFECCELQYRGQGILWFN